MCALYSRDEVIIRIIEEKGIKAIPNLIELLEDENPEVRELALEALSILAPEGKDYLLKEFKRRFQMNLHDDVVLLYLAELLSDFKCLEIKENLEMMFNRFSDERAFPLILENLLKVTQDEKYLDILETYLDCEDVDIEEICIMAVTELPSKKSINILLEKYYNTNNNSLQLLILDSLVKILTNDFDLVPYLRDKDSDIYEKLEWHIRSY